VPIATGERLITHHGCRELIEGPHPLGGTKPFVLLPVHEDGSIASP
jgi:hypothetical protein